MRDGCHIRDQINIEAGIFQNAHGGIPTRTRAFDVDIEGGKVGGPGLFQTLFDDGSRGERGGTAGAFETTSTGGTPTDDITSLVGKGNVSGIKGGLDVHLAVAVFESDFGVFFGCHTCFYFLPEADQPLAEAVGVGMPSIFSRASLVMAPTVFRLPLRVRALVRVR